MYKIYQVGYGDTVESIANMLGISVEELNTINGFNGNKLMMGDLIIVPNKSNTSDVFIKYKIKNGETLYMIAKNNDIDVDTLALLNGLNKDDYIYVDQEIIIPKDTIDVYVTRKGDTIDMVLSNLNTTLEKLKENNNDIYLKEDQLIIHKRDIY